MNEENTEPTPEEAQGAKGLFIETDGDDAPEALLLLRPLRESWNGLPDHIRADRSAVALEAWKRASIESRPEFAEAFNITRESWAIAEQSFSPDGFLFEPEQHTIWDFLQSHIALHFLAQGVTFEELIGQGTLFEHPDNEPPKKTRLRGKKPKPLVGFGSPMVSLIGQYFADTDRDKNTTAELTPGVAGKDGRPVWKGRAGNIGFAPIRTQAIKGVEQQAEIIAQHAAKVNNLTRDDYFVFLYALNQMLEAKDAGPVSIHLATIGKLLGVEIKKDHQKRDLARRVEAVFYVAQNAHVELEREQSLTDPITKAKVDIKSIRGPWLLLDMVHQDGQGVPVVFDLKPGSIMDNFKEPARQRSMLWPIFADWGRLAAIKSGQPSGDWAKSIGITGLSHARTNLNKCKPGEEGIVILTRRELINGPYRANTSVKAYNATHRHRNRAYQYFTEALGILSTEGIIDPVTEPPHPGTFEGWYEQSLTIRFRIDRGQSVPKGITT
jgi:hypothetical protein